MNKQSFHIRWQLSEPHIELDIQTKPQRIFFTFKKKIIIYGVLTYFNFKKKKNEQKK